MTRTVDAGNDGNSFSNISGRVVGSSADGGSRGADGSSSGSNSDDDNRKREKEDEYKEVR